MTNRLRILVVDDDPVVREIMVATLESWDYTVLAASSGLEAMRIHRNEKLDLVFCDSVMPDMDGVEAVTRLRNLSPQLPIIGMSVGGQERLAALKKAGASATSLKPISASDLDRLLTALIDPAKDQEQEGPAAACTA